jgi:hypothetical protein
MTTHDKAMLTYKLLQKRKQKKQEQERQHKQDADSIGWNGYQRFVNRELKRYY